MKRLTIGTILIIAIGIMACGNTNKNTQETTGVEQQEKKRSFQLPEVPVMLDTPEARAAFVCEHYWDHFDFADTAYIHLPDITEQAIVNFMDLMPRVSKELARKSMEILYQKAAPHSVMAWHFWGVMSRYWKDANSPVRNEDMFILLCQSVESAEGVELIMKQRASFARNLAEKNRLGQPAIDFVYTTKSGKQGRMYGLKADYTLLFFYNPDCHTCIEVKYAMKNSSKLEELVGNGKMKVLTIYPDEDLTLWRDRLHELSESWVNGYDKGQVLTQENLYDLSATPSFYLLDKDKKVLLKDADWNEVMHFF